MSERPRDEYLAELDATLPMPADRRREILEEIDAHLEDVVAERVAAGIPADRAETAAQERLGSPRELARELSRTDQAAWRILAAAGSGVRAAIGWWLYGYLLGALIAYLGVFALAAALQVADQMFKTGWTIGTSDGGWNTVFGSVPIGLGLYFAGRQAVDAVSIASRRIRDDVRPWVAAIGTAVAFAILVIAVDMQQNWASVVALSVAPLAVALGVYRPELIPRRVLPLVLIVGLSLVVPTIGLAIAGTGSTGAVQEIRGGPTDRNLSIVGPMWGPTWLGEEPLLEGGGWSTTPEGAIRVEWDIKDEPALAGLTDLRVEAWRSLETTFALDPRDDSPFATAPAARRDGMLVGEVVTTQTPGVGHWEMVLTGVGPDGERYVIGAGAGGNSTFTGSVWDWFTAVIGD
jgi:uncharacterized membrane protein